MLGNKTKQDTSAPLEPAPVFLDARRVFAKRFLAGEGLEIGALHQPLATPRRARVRYVDRLPVENLRAEYPELAGWDLTEVDVIDDGELLATVPESSQDFIVANHFLEHCEDPIRTIGTHLGKLRPGGVLFYAVPDKRYTFDHRRPPTPLEHMVADYEDGPQRSRAEHYEEWARFVEVPSPEDSRGVDPDEWAADRARELEQAAYSIHMHVWTQSEFLKLLLHVREIHGGTFDLEAAARQEFEFVVVLRKAGPPPSAAKLAKPPLRSLSRRARRKIRKSLTR